MSTSNNTAYLNGYYKAKIEAIKAILEADIYGKEEAIAAILEVKEEEPCEEI